MDDLLIKGALVYDGAGAEPAIKTYLKMHAKLLTVQVWP